MLEWFLLICKESVKNILWVDLQNAFVKTIPHCFFDEEKNLIEPHMENLMLKHLIGNNCPVFYNGLLEVTFQNWIYEVIFWNFGSGHFLSIPSWPSYITEIQSLSNQSFQHNSKFLLKTFFWTLISHFHH